MTVESEPFPYATARAFRTALRDRFAAAATYSGAHGIDELQRQFAYDRLLARVFTGVDRERWILKGAGALLARLPDARHSRDIDMAYVAESGQTEEAELEDAERSLRVAADSDLADHFRFEITRVTPLQEAAKGRRLHLSAYLGSKYATFHTDVVVGSIMTAKPDQFPPLTPVQVPGLTRPGYRLFPLADHVADKLCATIEVHQRDGHVQPSTRVKDLVDLVLIASTQRPSAAQLRHALEVGTRLRGLVLPDRFVVPELQSWRAGYPRKANDAAAELPSFDDAVRQAADFLDPVLAGIASGRWDPVLGLWR